jgi:hypothetical protein
MCRSGASFAVVIDERFHPQALQYLFVMEERQTDDRENPRHGRVSPGQERGRRLERAAGGDEIVNDEHFGTGGDIGLVRLDDISAVFERKFRMRMSGSFLFRAKGAAKTNPRDSMPATASQAVSP